MEIPETQINSTLARQILNEAKLNGVTVEDYLETLAEENQTNGNVFPPKIRRTETKIDLSASQKWLKENRQKYIGRWVVLEGERFIGAGANPKELVEKA